ncbi:MAG TPA: hypothetical protein VLL54_08950 [Pyrinomonadaceae bacterium]|nr:hypothetical protein [Pyrinomonadaceae bacterium]
MKAFTTFRGKLKRLVLDEDEPARVAAFQWAFPGFLDPIIEGRPAGEDQAPRMRRRRYSGGLFSSGKPLPRGRYSTVCTNSEGDDGWGLCQELRAYAGSTLRQKIFAYDLGESSLQQMFREKGWLVGQKIGLHFNDPDGEILARYMSIGDAVNISAADPGFWRTSVDYFVEDVAIDGTVDLRLPATQEWFCETFREGYGDFWKKPVGKSVNRFQEMLTTLMCSELGGSPVTDAIGLALRMMGASALIYPSARCDVEAVVIEGNLKQWIGFNLVDFSGWEIQTSEDEKGLQFADPDPWDIPTEWPNLRCEIAELTDDREFAEHWKGSWRISGVREGHEKFWEAGGLLGGREIGEWDKQETNLAGDFIRGLNRRLKQTKVEDEDAR